MSKKPKFDKIDVLEALIFNARHTYEAYLSQCESIQEHIADNFKSKKSTRWIDRDIIKHTYVQEDSSVEGIEKLLALYKIKRDAVKVKKTK